MFKRLLFAVFVLGLVFSLSGTAISGVGQKPVGATPNAIPTINSNAPHFNEAADARPAGALNRPGVIDNVQAISGQTMSARTPSEYFCDYFFYNGGAASYWGMPSTSRDVVATRFTVPEGYGDTLYAAWVVTYGGEYTGTPDVRIYLYDDDGFGFPGNKLDSGTILFADLALTYAYETVSWMNGPWVFEDGAEYHIGYSVLGGLGVDNYPIISDDGTTGSLEERTSILGPDNAPNWVLLVDLYDPIEDYAFAIESEACRAELPYSDCYSQSFSGGPAYVWRAPHHVYNEDKWAIRFSASSIETLSSVDIPVYDLGDPGGPDEFGNNDLIIEVWADDGSGYPGVLLATEVVPAGTYPAFPSYANIDLVSHGLVFDQEDFFVSFTSNGQGALGDGSNEATLSDDGLTAVGRAYVLDVGSATWYTMGYWWGGEYTFLYYANLCKDPYVDCLTTSYDVGAAYYWKLPDVYGDIASAQLMKAVGAACAVNEVSWTLYDWLGDGTNYQADAKVSILDDAGGLPGAELASVILTPADYVMFPGETTVDFPAVAVGTYYWIAIESYGALEDIATMTDAGGGGWMNGAAELWGTDWGLLDSDWGLGIPDIAFLASASTCCIPPEIRICSDVLLQYGSDWSTYQQNQARTGASGVSFSDAQCDLNVIWGYTHPLNNIFYTGPAIVGDRIACAWDNQVQVLDLATGANIYTLTGFPLGNQIRCTPTVAVVAGFNGDAPVMFLSGGDAESVSAWDFASGTMLWSRDITTVPGGPADMYGQTRYCPFILLNGVLYYGTDDAVIVALDATTGVLFGGWGVNPVAIGGTSDESGSTDGTSLFYNWAGAPEGDVISIDAATGAINWQLSSSAGLQAGVVYDGGPQVGEGFPAASAYDVETGKLFVNSHIITPTHPGDGILYSINAADGALNYAAPSVGYFNNNLGQSGPIIDRARIYVAGVSNWVTPPLGGTIVGFSKVNGAVAWAADEVTDNRHFGDISLTCEDDESEYPDDLLIIPGSAGFIGFRNSATGEEVFRRRVTYGSGGLNIYALNTAIGDGYIAVTDLYGSLHVLAKGDDRARLELQSYNPELPVEFGTATSLEVPIPGVLVNTGCVDLVFGQLETNVTGSQPWFPNDFAPLNVRPEVMDRAAGITDKLLEDWHVKAISSKPVNDLDDFFVRGGRNERMLNAGANAGVGFLQYANVPEAIIWPQLGDALAAGDTADILIDVNQSMVLRGPQDFFVVIPNNDADFFLHDVNGSLYGPPEIHVTIIGGCLIDTTTLAFGMGGGNTRLVANTGRIGTGDWDPHGIDIDGDDASFYQGSYIWANGVFEQATHSQDWTSGGGEADAWWSMQPDPNWCDDLCKAHIDEDVTLSCLGGYSEDGMTYTPIMGSRVCATYLDSMQDFSYGGTIEWTWDEWGAPFDNDLTMGLMCNSRTVGAIDFAPLKDITVDIMEITERNGDPVEGFKLGAFIDYDVSGDDIAIRSAEGSAAFVSDGGIGATQWGMMKFPFGCGDPAVAGNPNVDYTPLINAISGAGPTWFWEKVYMGDTAWSLLNLPPGTYESTLSGDREAHFTIASRDFVGGDTYELAVAQFGLHETDGSDAEIVALADLTNKWLGFGRGDVNNDGGINLADVVYLAKFVNGGGAVAGPIPFMHLGDVNTDGVVDLADVIYIADYLYANGDCIGGDWCF